MDNFFNGFIFCWLFVLTAYIIFQEYKFHQKNIIYNNLKMLIAGFVLNIIFPVFRPLMSRNRTTNNSDSTNTNHVHNTTNNTNTTASDRLSEEFSVTDVTNLLQSYASTLFPNETRTSRGTRQRSMNHTG